MLRYLLLLTALHGAGFAHAAEITRVLFNGRIITQDAAQPLAQAIAIAGDKIAAAGTNEAMRALAGASSQIVDLGGRSVIPGLIDSHIHAIRAGLSFSAEVSWIDIADLATGLQRIGEAARHGGEEFIVIAGGWNIQQFRERRRPTLAEIEQAAPGRSVYLQLAYNSVLMSADALRRLSINSDQDLPDGARFELDGQGVRTGWITGAAPAIVQLFDRLPKFERDKNIEGTRRFFRRLNEYGVTGVSDPGGHNLKPVEYAALFEMAAGGELTLRVAFSAFPPRAGHERDDLERLASEYAQQQHPLLQFNGIGECITWGFYNNSAPSAAQTREFEAVAMWAAARGMRLTIHWNNNESAHHVLDVFERINALFPLKDMRWSIAHLHDGSRTTITRMHKLGLGWLVQNAGYFATPTWLRTRGAALRETPPLASALRMGMAVGGGTDAHRVMSYNPFLSLRWMIDGVTAAGLVTRETDELLTREEALRIYTSGSAWFTGSENRRGALKPGFDADMAILDRDYLQAPLTEFGRTKSLLTMVGGRIVFADGPYASLEEGSMAKGSTEPAGGR